MMKKHFYVVAYDIADTKRRMKIVKLLEGLGLRVNLSVFECMLTQKQLKVMCEQFQKIIVTQEDQIIIYPICAECFTQIIYYPNFINNGRQKIIVI